MSDTFPITKSLGLEVEHVFESVGAAVGHDRSIVDAVKLERLLASGVRVYGGTEGGLYMYDGSFHNPFDAGEPSDCDTHTALLIDVKPIVRDTADSILRDLMIETNACGSCNSDYLKATNKAIERARRLVSSKKEKGDL